MVTRTEMYENITSFLCTIHLFCVAVPFAEKIAYIYSLQIGIVAREEMQGGKE